MSLLTPARRALLYALPHALKLPGCVGYYEADRIGAADAASVGTWRDQSRSGAHLSGAAAPVMDADGANGWPCLLFDGINDALTSTVSVSVRTVLYVTNYTGGITWGIGADITYFGAVGGTHYLYMGPGGGGVTTVAAVTGSWNVWTGRYSTTAGDIRRNGAQAGTGTHEADSRTGTLIVGNRPLADNPYAGRIAALALFDRYLSDGECRYVEHAWLRKYRINPL